MIRIRVINGIRYMEHEDGSMTNLSTGESLAKTQKNSIYGRFGTMNSIIIRSYSDFMTEKKRGTFKNLEDGMEIYLPKTPLFFAFLTELKLLYDTHGLLAYILDITDDYIVVALRED